MLTETSLCMGCMNDKTYDGPCKLCGYSDTDPYIPTYLAPKTTLNDRYIVGRLLSYNGEGAIYIGFDTKAGAKVTIKEFMPDTLCSRRKGETEIMVNSNNSPLYKTYMSEFEDLNRTLMKLDSTAHIQAVLDVFSENNTCYAIYEFINGISLKTFLANSSGVLTWDQVKELFPPIFTTLSLVHQEGIIHRGLSPQTIFVTDKMELKLTSFCISAARTTNTEIACEIFNGYAAPEQFTNDEMNGTWTDVYGIAAVLYRVLTNSTPVEALSGHTAELPEPILVNRNVPTNVSKVIMHGMAPSTEHRIRSIGDFVSRLFAPPKYTANAGGTKKPSETAMKNLSPNAQRRLKKQQKERRKTLVVLIIAGVTLIMFTIVFALAMNGKFAPDPNPNSSGSSTGGSSQSGSTTQSVPVTPPVSSAVISSTTSDDESNSVPELIDTVQVPDLDGSKYETAVTQFEGFFTFVPTYVYSETYRAGLMFDQSVEAGTTVEKGTQIHVMVSKGSSTVPLPAYKDMKGDDYVAKLSSLNIKYSIEEIRSIDIKKGYVVRCSKNVGDIVSVSEGETVIVYVSKGVSGGY